MQINSLVYTRELICINVHNPELKYLKRSMRSKSVESKPYYITYIATAQPQIPNYRIMAINN